MPLRRSVPIAFLSPYTCRFLAALLILTAAALHLVFLSIRCPLDLAPVGAHDWAWSLVCAHRAVFRGSTWAWPLTGFLLGIGILAKYTMVIFLPSLGLFLVFTPEHRRLLLRPGFWIMAAVAGLCCLPILIWNAQHEWMTFRHVLGLSGMAEAKEESHFHWLGPIS